MIVEGFVTVNQDDKELKLKNHLTANLAKFLFRLLMMSYVQTRANNSAVRELYFYLMGTYQIRLGSGTTQVPTPTLTALQSQCLVMPSSPILLVGNYSEAAPFDINYGSTVNSLALCSAFAGVTISTIVQDVIAIQSDPPVSPVTGDTYIVASPATGDWIGNENKVATYNGATWDFVTPDTSYAASVTGTPNVPYRFDGTSWIEIVNKCRECGIFTYGPAISDAYQWTYQSTTAGIMSVNNVYALAAYVSANGGTPDFNVGDIDICKSLSIEWKIRVAFTGD